MNEPSPTPARPLLNGPGMKTLTFVAVSGVRVYNQALLDRGLTLPGFVERAEVVASMPSLGLLTLAGLTPDRYRVRYVELPEYDEAVLAGLDADLVAISSFTAKAHVMYAAADFLRARGVTVVLGGLHVTQLPHEAARHATTVVVGEGERVWPKLLDDWEHGALRPLYRAWDLGPVDLGQVARPRYELLELDRYNRLPLQTTRGCPLACEFCAASRTLGPYRKKPLACVKRELDAVTALWRRPFIELADDNTFVDKAWSRGLVELLGAAGVRWFTEADISVADDLELVRALGPAGCRQVLVGLESPRRGSLRGVDPAGWKARRADGYRRAIDTLQSHGVSVNGCFVLGLDDDGPEVFEEVARFVEESGLAEVQVTVQTPFPGTALERRLRAEGHLRFEGDWQRRTLFDVCFEPKRMSAAQLEQGLLELMDTLYAPGVRQARHRRFLAQARHGLEARPCA